MTSLFPIPNRCRWISAAICIASLLGLGILFLVNPAAAGWIPPCPFHALTGLDCPGCGSLRAIHSLLHGQWAQALAFNPLACFCLPFMGAWLLWHAARAVAGRAPAVPFIRPTLLWLVTALVLAFGVARNALPPGAPGGPRQAETDKITLDRFAGSLNNLTCQNLFGPWERRSP